MRMLTLSVTLAAIAISLAACQTAAERRAGDEKQCLSYGFRRGTDSFATCLQRIDLSRSAAARYNSDMLMLDMSYNIGGPYYGRPYYYRRYR